MKKLLLFPLLYSFCMFFLISCGSSPTPQTTLNPQIDTSTPHEDTSSPKEDTSTPPIDTSAKLYKGEWLWLAEFPGTGIQFTGFLSVSEKSEGTDTLLAPEGGIWRWCIKTCTSISGIGLVSRVKPSSNTVPDLTTVFYDGDIIKMLALDKDKKIGFEVDDSPTIIGRGLWYFTSGGDSLVNFGMVKISDTPKYPQDSSSVESQLAPQHLNQIEEQKSLILLSSKDQPATTIEETETLNKLNQLKKDLGY